MDDLLSLGMLTCALCGKRRQRSPFCSDLAVLAVHWMNDHPSEYVRLHPETRPYLVGAGVLDGGTTEGKHTGMNDPDVTPPLDEFLREYEADDNEWWRLGCGHHMNLFDKACDRLEESERQLADVRDLHPKKPAEIHGLVNYDHCGRCTGIVDIDGERSLGPEPWPCATLRAIDRRDQENG